MPSWIIVAALLSILATMWLAWLLWRVNVGPQTKRSSEASDGGVFAESGGKTRNDSDAADGSDGGGDGGGGD